MKADYRCNRCGVGIPHSRFVANWGQCDGCVQGSPFAAIASPEMRCALARLAVKEQGVGD